MDVTTKLIAVYYSFSQIELVNRIGNEFMNHLSRDLEITEITR